MFSIREFFNGLVGNTKKFKITDTGVGVHSEFTGISSTSQTPTTPPLEIASSVEQAKLPVQEINITSRDKEELNVLNFLKTVGEPCEKLTNEYSLITNKYNYSGARIFGLLNLYEVGGKINSYNNEEKQKLIKAFSSELNDFKNFTPSETELIKKLISRQEYPNIKIIIKFFITLKSCVDINQKFDKNKFISNNKLFIKKELSTVEKSLQNKYFLIFHAWENNNNDAIKTTNHPFTFEVILKCIDEILEAQKNLEEQKNLEAQENPEAQKNQKSEATTNL